MSKEAVSNKRVSGQISANYNCWNSETPPLQGPLMTHMLSWATISTSYNTTFSYCFPIGLPSLITNYLVFSLLSLSQPLKCYCKGTYLHFPLLSTLSLHVETILLGAGWISGRSKWEGFHFNTGLLLHNQKSHVTTLTSSWLVPHGMCGQLGPLPPDKDCCLPHFSFYLP